MDKVNLKDYICSVPFTSLEIDKSARYLCCSAWLKEYLPLDTSPKDAWESDTAYKIRESMLDGSYKYCDKTQCPHLSQLVNIGDVSNNGPIQLKSKISTDLHTLIDEHKNKSLKPTVIQFSFDRSCNLQCPSCRVKIITADRQKIKEIKSTIDVIESQYGNSVKTLYITGTGDPFISVGFRDFLRNFDATKWPNLKNIHLHTNATKWDSKMWDSMSNIHKYVKTCEISIDAGTKDTYENKTRLGGDWDTLIDNLKFISKIPTLKRVKTSFVVQTHNYKEMKLFYELMNSIFGSKTSVYYGKILNWGTFTNEEYLKHKVWDVAHPLHNDFVKEVNSFILKDNVWHNLQEFVTSTKNII